MKNLRLATAIKQLRYNEFIQLYLQLMKLTEKYVATTKNEVLLFVFEKNAKGDTVCETIGSEVEYKI